MENIRLDSELPIKMASLDIWEGSSNAAVMEEERTHSEGSGIRRSGRKTIKPQSTGGVTNRRVILKPRKRELKISMTEEELRSFYCNQKVKRTSNTLETILEEPKADGSCSTTIFLGSRKIKRSLSFPVGSRHTKEKIKRRRSKIKRLLGSKNFLNRKKLSMQNFIKKLQTLDPDEPINASLLETIDNENKETEE